MYKEAYKLLLVCEWWLTLQINVVIFKMKLPSVSFDSSVKMEYINKNELKNAKQELNKGKNTNNNRIIASVNKEKQQQTIAHYSCQLLSTLKWINMFNQLGLLQVHHFQLIRMKWMRNEWWEIRLTPAMTNVFHYTATTISIIFFFSSFFCSLFVRFSLTLLQ